LVSPASIPSGTVIIGQTNIQSFQLANPGGQTLTGTVSTALPFRVQSGTPFSVLPGQTGTVSVSFAPVAAGAFSNVVVFLSNGGNSTNPVSGVGLTPGQLGVLPPSLDFGAVTVGSTAQASFVITNRGGTALTNGTASVGAGPFAIVSGTPFTLPGFSSTNLVISFNPGTAATFSNVVVVSTGNGGNSTNPVTGIGANIPAAAFTASPTSGLKPLTVAFIDSSTGTITNHFWDFGDGSTTNTTTTTLSHTYTDPNLYSVSLTISGPLGVNTSTRTNYIVVTVQPLITDVKVSGANVTVSFTSSAGVSYSLDYTDALNPAAWNVAVSPIPGTGNVISATHVGGATRKSRFYRISQLP